MHMRLSRDLNQHHTMTSYRRCVRCNLRKLAKLACVSIIYACVIIPPQSEAANTRTEQTMHSSTDGAGGEVEAPVRRPGQDALSRFSQLREHARNNPSKAKYLIHHRCEYHGQPASIALASLRVLRKSAQSRFPTAVGMLCAALLRLLAAGAIFFRALSSQWHCRFLQTELCSLNGTLLRAILARFLSPQRVVSRGACARNPRCLI